MKNKQELETLIRNLIKYPSETEWLEFKENIFNDNETGEYISALSNSAVIHNCNFAYMIWGVSDIKHNIVGTSINFHKETKSESIQHFIARQLEPSIDFEFDEIIIDNKKIVILTIPKAIDIPTSFNRERYIRIGSSKENIKKYPKREAQLWNYLKNGMPTIVNTSCYNQHPTFKYLQNYIVAVGLHFNEDTFIENFKLKTKDNEFNMMANLLADENDISIKVVRFNGTEKADGIVDKSEFGFKCLLVAMEKAEDYVDSQNLNKSIMTEKGARIDKKLFDKESFKQAWYNACLHNLWIEGVPPAVYIFSDRIQVLSNGGLPANLMFDDFYKGTSRPVNEELARIFLSLELMEQTGYGIPIIVKKYSKKAFDFSPNTIRVDLMFNEEVLEAERAWKEKILSSHDTKNDTKNDTKHNTNTLEKELINLIQHNQNITQAQIIENLKISRSTLVRYLRLSKKIKRVGSKTNGHWEIINN